jgi:hypothetical protein
MITQLDLFPRGIAPIESMPLVYYVFWATENTKWKFKSYEKGLEFKKGHKHGWDMTGPSAVEEDESTDTWARLETSDEQA